VIFVVRKRGGIARAQGNSGKVVRKTNGMAPAATTAEAAQTSFEDEN
jgi:hypothetical protein